MSVMIGRTGAYAYTKYGWESTFGSGSSNRSIPFGRGVRITELTKRENPELFSELGVREYKTHVFKQVEGRLGVEFLLSNPWIFKAVLGSVTSSGSGPYTHTYTMTKIPTSIEAEVGATLSGSTVVRLLRGCIVDSLSITATVGDVVRARCGLLYAKEVSGTSSSPIVDTFEPYVFQHATLETPSGTVLAGVQTFDLTIRNNAMLTYHLGSREAIGGIWQNFDLEGRLSMIMSNADNLGKLATEVSTGKLKLEMTGATITINFSGLVFGEHRTTLEPNALILEEVPIMIKNITSIVAENNSTHP